MAGEVAFGTERGLTEMRGSMFVSLDLPHSAFPLAVSSHRSMAFYNVPVTNITPAFTFQLSNYALSSR